MDIEKIIEELGKKKNYEITYAFFEMLSKNRVSFNDVAIKYAEWLEYENMQKRITINGLAIPLSAYLDGNIHKSQKKFIKAKAAWNLLKASTFTHTPYADGLQDIVDKIGYSEDEKGHHTIINK